MTLLLLLCWTKAFKIHVLTELKSRVPCAKQGPSLLLSRQWLLFKGMGISLTASLSLLLLLSQRFPLNHFVNFFASFPIVIPSVRRVATSQKSRQQARFYPSFTLYLNFSHKEERGPLFVSRHSDAAILGCHRAGKQQTTLLQGASSKTYVTVIHLN